MKTKMLQVRMSEVQDLSLDDVATVVNTKKSSITRAAMYLGLQQIKVLAAKDVEKARELVATSDTRAQM